MFRPKEMKKLRLITLDEYKYELIEGLHEKGIVEIKDVKDELEKNEWSKTLKEGEASENLSKITSKILRINKTLDLFDKAKEEKDVSTKEKIKSFLNPELEKKQEPKQGELSEILKETDNYLTKLEKKLKPLNKKLNEIKSEKNEINSFITQIGDYKEIKIPLEYIKETEFTYSTLGKIANEDIEKLEEEIQSITEKYVLETNKIDEETSVFFFLAYKENEEKIQKSLRDHSKWRFKPPEWAEKTPKKAITESKEKISELENKKQEINKKIREIKQNQYSKIKTYLNRLEIEKERAEVQNSFAKTEKTSLIEGWIPEDRTNELEELIEEKTNGYAFYELKKPQNPEEVPTELNNPKIFQPFETLVEMFNLPGYDEIDPTPVFAITFIVFVGLCLTDAGYGLLNLSLGLVLLKGPGKASRKIKDLGTILAISGGFSSIIWGLMTGGIFGSLFNQNLGGLGWLPSNWYPWVSPLTSNAVDILVLSILIGVFYLGLGLIVGIWQNVTRGNIKMAIEEQLTWLVVLVCGTPLVVAGLTGETFTGGLGTATSALWGQIAVLAILASLGTAMYLAGPIAIMELPGFFGDIVSFARLLALAVATGGIASIVNILSFEVLPGFHPALYLISVPLLLIGHIGNYAFQTLGAFIHSMRLQYVEFFGTFYSGTGEKFQPFSMKNKTKD